MHGAFIETELVTAVVPSPSKPLKALAMALREILNAHAVGLCLGVRAVFDAETGRAIFSYIGFYTRASSIVANAIL
jgi:hypothetical protein